MRIYSPTKQKILLLLNAGLVLTLRKTTIGNQVRIIKQVKKEWRKINRQYLYRSLHEFYNNRLIEYQELDNGEINIVLSEAGRKRVLKFDFDRLTLPKPNLWKGKWQVVIYDIPEKLKKGRESFRYKLKELGFYEWQKSVFVYPFECRDQIDFVVEFFDLRPYVRYAELINPTNEAELKLHFNL